MKSMCGHNRSPTAGKPMTKMMALPEVECSVRRSECTCSVKLMVSCLVLFLSHAFNSCLSSNNSLKISNIILKKTVAEIIFV